MRGKESVHLRPVCTGGDRWLIRARSSVSASASASTSFSLTHIFLLRSYLFIDAIKPKLRSKSHSQGLLAVLLLEALVKNVPACHEIVATRDVMEAHLVKALPRSIRKPNEGPSLNSLINEPGDQKSPLALARWEAILRCVASWAHSFDSNRYPIFHETLRMLERRGVRFPVIQKGEDAPVFTPKQRLPVAPPAASSGGLSAAPPSSASAQSHSSSRVPAVGSDPKLNAELKSAGETASLFMSMLSGAEAGFPLTEDELIQQLYATCRSNAGMLSGRLTAAANGQAQMDEASMAAVISTHESITEAIQYYEGLVSGTAKPGGPAGRRPRPSMGGEEEQKQDHLAAADFDDDHPRRSHPHPQPQQRSQQADFDLMGAAAAAPAVAAIASHPAPVAHARRKSDLPPELQSFDLLITPSPPPPAAAQPQASVVASAPSPDSVAVAAADPFDVGFPPATNPAVRLHVQPAASLVGGAAAAAAAAPGSATKRSVTSPLIAPPPTSATRHRKDSQAKRGSAEFAASPLAGGVGVGAASAQQTPSKPLQPQFSTSPRAEGETLDFFEQQQQQQQEQPQPQNDFFGKSSIATTELFGQPPQPQQPQQTTIPFGDDLSFMQQQQQPPAQHVAPVNVFDMLEASPARGAVAAPAAAGGGGGAAAAAVSYNPFGDEHEADPFAAIASRSPPKQGNVFDF
jgi:hypothetical protein